MTQDSFQARLERIGTNSPSNTPEALATPAPSAALPDTRNIMFEFAMVPVAFLSGWGSVLFAMWVQFHFLTDQGEFGFSGGELVGGFLGDIVIAIVVSLILVQLLNLKSPMRRGAEIAGFVAGLFGMHIFVEMMPTAFASLFSIEWVLYTLEYL